MILAFFRWCKPHVDECVECQWWWFEILQRAGLAHELEELGLALPAAIGDETEA